MFSRISKLLIVCITLIVVCVVQQVEAGTWTQKADMPTARERHGACVVDGRIYVFGGGATHPDVVLTTAEVYDPATDTWTQASDMPRPSMGHTASAVDGKIYIIGGLFSIVYVYDPVTDTWTTAADPLPTPRAYLTAAVVDGRIYAIGGQQGTTRLPTVEEYDPSLSDNIAVTSPAGKLLRTWGEVKFE